MSNCSQNDTTSASIIASQMRVQRLTWRYDLAHPDFVRLIAIEDMNRARRLRRSTRILDLDSPLVPPLAALIERAAAAGTSKAGLDPLMVYLSIAAPGVFYLAHRWTLSTIVGRDLQGREGHEVWEQHMVDATLASVRRERAEHPAR